MSDTQDLQELEADLSHNRIQGFWHWKLKLEPGAKGPKGVVLVLLLQRKKMRQDIIKIIIICSQPLQELMCPRHRGFSRSLTGHEEKLRLRIDLGDSAKMQVMHIQLVNTVFFAGGPVPKTFRR